METIILLIEDDTILREGMGELLSREGYGVLSAGSVREAETIAAKEDFGLCLMDVGLPDGNGVSLCKKWREEGREFPIIFLTALDDEIQVVRALDAGGSDYVTKPFRTQELLSRIRAHLRGRSMGTSPAKSGSVTMDINRLTVTADGKTAYITPTEARILQALMQNSGCVLTRAILLEKIWDAGGAFIDDNTLSVHISRLREKIGADRIQTIRGVGYRWEEKI